tara:strand:+ start:244 stop:1398 length:1155 start_codon:yes stop_codon:yes gene_type:complete
MNSSSFESLKKQFQLDPKFIYLNHGSFGACPLPIFKEREKWQKKIERQPVSFIQDKAINLLDWSRDKLSKFIHCDKNDVVYFPNPTTAMNMVIKSLDLNPGDEVLSSNHEYGAIEKTWQFMVRKKGFSYNSLDIPLPVTEDNFIDIFKTNITPKTKIIFLSHITSPTGIIFPVEKICKIAKKLGIITIIDGAHAPAHIDLNIKNLGVDIYTGACHKWMLCPKGVSFLYCSKKIQKKLEPLIVSWGWESDTPSSSQFLDHNQYQGTNDISSYLSVPEAIKFLNDNNWKEIRKNCRKKTIETREILIKTCKTDPICDKKLLGQMTSIKIDISNGEDLYKFLKKNNIEIPIIYWNKIILIRVSYQCYNSMQQIDLLNYYLKKYLDSI